MKAAIVALLANLSVAEAAKLDGSSALDQSSLMKQKVDEAIQNYQKNQQQNGNSAEADWSFLQNMAKVGAFFTKPGLLGPDNIKKQ